MTEAFRRICYLEASTPTGTVPSGFRVSEVGGTRKRTLFKRTWTKSTGPMRIVYREQCRLSWDDLELVSFVPGASSRGVLCWCDLQVRLADPEAALGELSETLDGLPTIRRESLEAWFRPRLIEVLEMLGGQGDLGSEAFWPSVARGVSDRLDCPPGIVLDDGHPVGHPPRSACVLRKVRSYEQYVEEAVTKEELRAKLAQVRREGQQALAALETDSPGLSLLTAEERALGESDRWAVYQQVLDQPPSRRQMLVQMARQGAADPGRVVRLRKSDLRARQAVYRSGTAFRDIGTRRIATLPINSPLQFELDSQRAGYATLLNVATSGRVWLLIPNAYAGLEDARLADPCRLTIPGTALLPREQLEFHELDFLEVGPPGWEHLIMVVSDRPLAPASAVERSRPSEPFVELAGEELEAVWQELVRRTAGSWSADVLSFLVGD